MGFKSLEIEIGTILDKYENIPVDVIEKSARKTARDTVNKLKNTSPRKTGEYASGWSARKQGHGYVVFNKKKPGLTQLLEYGHDVYNKLGKVGRAGAHVHIAPVEKEANTEFEENIEREMRRRGLAE